MPKISVQEKLKMANAIESNGLISFAKFMARTNINFYSYRPRLYIFSKSSMFLQYIQGIAGGTIENPDAEDGIVKRLAFGPTSTREILIAVKDHLSSKYRLAVMVIRGSELLSKNKKFGRRGVPNEIWQELDEIYREVIAINKRI